MTAMQIAGVLVAAALLAYLLFALLKPEKLL
jgi:K+-transporting ATPase KdpF subunit